MLVSIVGGVLYSEYAKDDSIEHQKRSKPAPAPAEAEVEKEAAVPLLEVKSGESDALMRSCV